MKARKLNKEERNLIVTTVNRHKRRRIPFNDSLRVAYNEVGNFTLATVFLGPNRVISGAAKRNPTDAVNPLAGQMRALSRALQSHIVVY